jgi:hypothetical protein
MLEKLNDNIILSYLWQKAQKLAELQYEEENGIGTWLYADKYEKEDYTFSAYMKLQKKENENMMRDSKGRFCKATENTNNVTNANNTYKKENETMTNTNTTNNATRKSNKEIRMQILADNGVDTSKFFNLSLSNIPVGTPVKFNIGGMMYDLTPSVSEGWDHFDEIVNDILDNGFVFNRRTDGRFVVAQTFQMLNGKSWNSKTRKEEYGWDAYLRNEYGYMYQFEMMKDELKRLARMEQDNDPEFARLSRFFTKEVVIKTCEHYIKQLKKHVDGLTYDETGKKRKLKKHRGMEYIHLSGIAGQDYRGNVHVKDLDIVYSPLNKYLYNMRNCKTYKDLHEELCDFMKVMPELNFDTPKCGAWKDAFKAKGAYVTLLNIIKFHGVTINPEMDVYRSINYVEDFAKTHRNELWRLHTLLKSVIEINNFDLKKSIESQKK